LKLDALRYEEMEGADKKKRQVTRTTLLNGLKNLSRSLVLEAWDWNKLNMYLPSKHVVLNSI
jgi:hypothetical protein